MNYGVDSMQKDIIGRYYIEEFTVDASMTAVLGNVEIHPVCSTVTMVYYAELASRRVIEPLFTEGENAIGAGISLEHVGMAAIGDSIEMKATINSFDGKLLVCDITARLKVSNKLLCKGTQAQVVLSQNIISEMIEKAYSQKDL
jgi:predicted thioesterase